MEVWRGIGEGLPAVIVNPSTILGYGDWNTSSCAIFQNVYSEFPWYTEGINGFVDVADAARAIVRLLETESTANAISSTATIGPGATCSKPWQRNSAKNRPPRSHPVAVRYRMAAGKAKIHVHRPQGVAYPRKRTGSGQQNFLQQR